MKDENNIIVITGIDSGIGKSLAEQMTRYGFTIVGSYLDNNPFADNPNIITIKMDLRNPVEVDEFCNQVKKLCENKKLLAVVANSGVALGGSVENIPLEIYRESFEINYFGVVRIVQALIPELILSKGKIVVNGSMAGKVAMPFMSPYTSTKFALEGFCDSLRREMNPLGIKTILLEPSAVATLIWEKAKKQDISFMDEKYLDSLYSFRDKFIEGGTKGMDSDLAAVKIDKIIRMKKPKARYIIAENVPVSRLVFLIPNIILDKLVIKMFNMHYGKKR